MNSKKLIDEVILLQKELTIESSKMTRYLAKSIHASMLGIAGDQSYRKSLNDIDECGKKSAEITEKIERKKIELQSVLQEEFNTRFKKT